MFCWIILCLLVGDGKVLEGTKVGRKGFFEPEGVVLGDKFQFVSTDKLKNESVSTQINHVLNFNKLLLFNFIII